MLQRVRRDFTDFPKHLKREANRRRAADSGRIVGKPEVIRLLPHRPSSTPSITPTQRSARTCTTTGSLRTICRDASFVTGWQAAF